MDKLTFLKFVDKMLGRFLVSRLSDKIAPDSSSSPNKILFIRPGGIGDAVLLMPVIKAVKEKYPEAQIDVLAEKRNGGVFLLFPEIRDVYLYDRPKELIAAVRNKYDAVIDTEQWHRLSAVIAYLTRAPLRIGFATNERERLFTQRIPYSHDDYEVHSFFNLIAPIVGKIDFDLERPFLSIPLELSKKVEPMLQPLSGKDLVAIFPGGSIAERRWGAERFHDTAKMLAQRGYGIVVVGGKEDVRDGKRIVENLPGVLNLCGRLSLCETAAVLKEASLLITGDSGIMHIAYGLGVKTLSLFGPGIEKKWAPRGETHLVINKTLDCGPCTKFGNTPKCKNNSECMKRITVDEVYESSIELLEWGQDESKKM